MVELRPWTLPNLLTFGRLAALPFLVVAILEGRHRDSLIIFVAAALTDLVDGFIARRFDMTSLLGAVLDPICDKLFLVSTFVVFALPGTPTQLHVPMWVLVLMIFRDLTIVTVCLVMFIFLGVKKFPPSALGKATTFTEAAAIVAILLANVGLLPTLVGIVCLHLTGTGIVLSGLHYAWRTAMSKEAQQPKGPDGPEPRTT